MNVREMIDEFRGMVNPTESAQKEAQLQDRSSPDWFSWFYILCMVLMATRTFNIYLSTFAMGVVGMFFSALSLIGSEIASMVWKRIMQKHSLNVVQLAVAIVMVVITFVFSAATSIADVANILHVVEYDLDKLGWIAGISAVLLIVINAAAYVVYDWNSDFKRNQRDHQKAIAEAELDHQKLQLEIETKIAKDDHALAELQAETDYAKKAAAKGEVLVVEYAEYATRSDKVVNRMREIKGRESKPEKPKSILDDGLKLAPSRVFGMDVKQINPVNEGPLTDDERALLNKLLEKAQSPKA